MQIQIRPIHPKSQIFAAGKVYFLLLIFLKGISTQITAYDYASTFGPHTSQTKELVFFLIAVRFQKASVDTPKSGLSFYVNTNGLSFKQKHSQSVVGQRTKADKP